MIKEWYYSKSRANRIMILGLAFGIIISSILLSLTISCGAKYDGFGSIGCFIYAMPGVLILALLGSLVDWMPIWIRYIVVFILNVLIFSSPFLITSWIRKKQVKP